MKKTTSTTTQKLLHIQRATQTDTCVPRGAKAQYDPMKRLEFQILHWNALDEGDIPEPILDEESGRWQRSFSEERQYTIYITGSTKLGNSVTLRTTFDPYFLLKLETHNGRRWAQHEINEFINNQLISKWESRGYNGGGRYVPRNYSVVSDPDNPDEEERKSSMVWLSFESTYRGFEELELKDVDAGFTGIEPKKFQFIKLSFSTRTAMKRCASRAASEFLAKELAKKRMSVKVYEANIEPHIRFMHLTKVEAAGWCKVSGGKYQLAGLGTTQSKIDINLPRWSDLEPVDKPEIARFRQVSFDLETYSPDDGKFPNAVLQDNYIIQIASTVSDFGVDENDETKGCWRYLYTLKRCPTVEQPRTRTVCFENERDMLLAWGRFIQETNPDIVHAYNGFEFDYGYLAERAMVTGCWEQFRKLLGRFPDQPSQLIEKVMKSNAYGDNHWKILTMSGRLVIDPMVYIKREFNLPGHSLKFVSEHFLAEKLNANPLSTTAGSTTMVVSHPSHGLVEDKVIHFSGIDTPEMVETEDESYYVFCGWTYEDLHGDGDGGQQPGLHRISRVIDEDHYEVEMPTPATKTCQGGGKSVKVFETKHDISFPDMFRAWREQDMDVIHKVGLYCIQDTLLPQKILDKLCVLPNLIEMAKVTWVPVEDILIRGQQIKVFSQILKIAYEQGWAVPTVQKHKIGDDGAADDDDDDEGGYVGGAVLEPDIGFHDDKDPIGVPDFMSLYPTTMIDGNMCYTSLVKNPKYLGLPGVVYNHVEIDEKTTHTFAMNYDGLVPQILIHLLVSRSKRKKDMNNAPNAFMKMIHNGAQLALKVSANSIYGFTGVTPEKAMLPCMPIAESTTSRGRRGTFLTRDWANDINNFRDVIACTTHFPLYYVYLMKNLKKGSCFHLTAEELLGMFNLWDKDKGCINDGKLPLQEPVDERTPVVAVDGAACGLAMWTDEEWATITGFSRVRRNYIEGDLIRVHSDKGSTLNMNHYSLDDPNGAFCKVVYGDSVTGDTPIMVKNAMTNQVHICAIEEFPKLIEKTNSEEAAVFIDWTNGFKMDGEDRREKERIDLPEQWLIWTDEGWKRMRKLIRHKVAKKIYSIATGNGYIKVTEDHSLISEDGQKVKPGDLCAGYPLKTSFPTVFEEQPAIVFGDLPPLISQTDLCIKCGETKVVEEFYFRKSGRIMQPCKQCQKKKNATPGKYATEYSYTRPYELTPEEAWVWGFFMADGSCGTYNSKYGVKNSWAINNQSLDFLNRAKGYLEKVEPHFDFKILDTLKSSGVYKLVSSNGRMKFLVQKYRRYMYDEHARKVVPSIILNAPFKIRRSFYDGYYVGDGTKNTPAGEFTAKNQVSAQSLYYLCKSLGHHHLNLNKRADKDAYRVRIAQTTNDRHLVRRILQETQSDIDGEFVYDVETEIGRFHAGVGELIASNTDSVFCRIGCRHLYHSTQAMRVAYVGIVCAVMGHKITSRLKDLNLSQFKPHNKQWMLLEYEKTYRFWIIFSKKRYVGEVTEFDPYNYKDDEKGVAKKRRDFCSFVKEVYSKILKALFDDDETLSREQRIANALAVVRRAVEDLLNNRVPFEKLIISKSLKDSYRAREKKQSTAKKAAKSDFGPHNIYTGDEVIWKHRGWKCIGVVEAKREVSIDAFLKGGGNRSGAGARSTKALTVKLREVEDRDETTPGQLRDGAIFDLGYDNIQMKCAGVITLDKIMNPKTSDDELVAITNAHVRLARRMYLRDPATAPPSGSRVPYVFCEPENANVLQYLRAENPRYAKEHKMKIDPIYYLEKQCAKAWGQILNTIQPGLVDQIFNEAYSLYEKRRAGQTELSGFLAGNAGGLTVTKRIKLSENVRTGPAAVPAKKKVIKKGAVAVGPGQQTLSKFFQPQPSSRPAEPKPVVKKRERTETETRGTTAKKAAKRPDNKRPDNKLPDNKKK